MLPGTLKLSIRCYNFLMNYRRAFASERTFFVTPGTCALFATFFLFILFSTSCSSTLVKKETSQTITSIPSLPKNTLQPTQLKIQSSDQQLRITNQGSLLIHNLVVVFPDDRITFGDVLPGAATDYQIVPHGVYRYAAYNVNVDGKIFEQPVVDWIGEAPMEGKSFTYILELDPSRWETENQVIRLIKVSKDR